MKGKVRSLEGEVEVVVLRSSPKSSGGREVSSFEGELGSSNKLILKSRTDECAEEGQQRGDEEVPELSNPRGRG